MFVKIFLLNFHPKANFSGRERCPSTPKCVPSPEGTRSRIEYHRVRKTPVEAILRGFILFKTSILVTFGHHFENGGIKNAPKRVKKMSEISLFEGKQQIIIFIFCYTPKYFSLLTQMRIAEHWGNRNFSINGISIFVIST